MAKEGGWREKIGNAINTLTTGLGDNAANQEASNDAVWDDEPFNQNTPATNEARIYAAQVAGHNVPNETQLSRDQYEGLKNKSLIVNEDGKIVPR